MNIFGDTTSLSDTPCIGICSSSQFGDKRCRGCGRFDFEIREWNALDDQQKKELNMRNWGDYPIKHRDLTEDDKTLLLERIILLRKLEQKEEEIHNNNLLVDFTVYEGEEVSEVKRIK